MDGFCSPYSSTINYTVEKAARKCPWYSYLWMEICRGASLSRRKELKYIMLQLLFDQTEVYVKMENLTTLHKH